MIQLDALSQINRIIEQDKISSTYKFALLKNTIDVCQRYDHLINIEDEQAHLPLGLVVEGWLFDYFPFVFNGIRQQNSGNVLNKKIESIYTELFDYMKLDPKRTTWQDAYAKVYMQYQTLNLDPEQSKILLKVAKQLATTIVKMPMRYSGETDYEIYSPQELTFGKVPKTQIFNREFLIKHFGTFTIKKDHYNIFRYMGQSLYGNSTIARRWRETTYKLNHNTFINDQIDEMIYKTIFTDRNTTIARKYLPNECTCVWSGKKLRDDKFDIDHVLPYSVWYNNDLWNLLPCDSKINSKKSDKIPSPDLILRQRDIIISYWEIYEKKAYALFNQQIQSALLPNSSAEGKKQVIEALCDKSEYLISQRGYSAFSI